MVTAIGWRAHAALAASGGRVDVVAPLSASCYGTAGGELVWIGPPGSTLHGRAIVTAEGWTGAEPPGRSAERTVSFSPGSIIPWRPPPLTRSPLDAVAALRALRESLAALGTPRGFGCLLRPAAGDDAIVRRARPWARALAAACAAGDVDALADAARPLLGLGEGLTPSGDDFVGGALFARRLVGRDERALDGAAARIVADAASRTHPISARLLADLGAGEGWAPLHDLVAALVAQDAAAAVTAARRLTALGHSSGWDIHSGLVTGLGYMPDPNP
jgi:hypothetical protein